jgi:hypothetical protein
VFLDEGEREFIGEFACVTQRGSRSESPPCLRMDCGHSIA